MLVLHVTPLRMDELPAIGFDHADDLPRPSSGMIVAMSLVDDKMAKEDM